MKILYVGQYSDGTTSRMRADQLRDILEPQLFDVIDTHIPFFRTKKLFRSFGFRYKMGPLVWSINRYMQQNFKQINYDLIWVDKGVFLNQRSIRLLYNHAKKLIHFTPDPAFTYHRSRLFNNSLVFYDYLITTKSFELESYKRMAPNAQIFYVTQGFDKKLHKKKDAKNVTKKGLIFIGHHETEREQILQNLLDRGLSITLAGIKWDKFADGNKHIKNLKYLGIGVYGADYVRHIQEAQMAWGAISKWIPEKHTTRTFEIPACGTALLTERNDETSLFFKEDEAIFYDTIEELIDKVLFYTEHSTSLEKIAQNGHDKVHSSGYDYESILSQLLEKIL